METAEPDLNIAHEIQLLLNSRGTSANHHAQANQPSCQNVRKRCSSCKDYGEQLIQCSSCSAAFHSECLDPPLPRNSSPTCESFRCSECVWQATQRRTQRHAQVQGVVESVSTASDSSNAKVSKPEAEESGLWSRAAQHVARRNPSEFSVPNEITLNVAVPGSYKQQVDRPRSNNARNAPVCYYCEQSSVSAVEAVGAGQQSAKGARGRINAALLVRCDYCDAAFHLDCLPEPLTVPPSRSEWWMCPLHAEHSLDRRVAELETRRLLDAFAEHDNQQPEAKRSRFLAQPHSASASLSHRVTVWNELVRTPIDTHVTKAQFLRKLHRDAAWKRENGASRFASFASLFSGWSQPRLEPVASAPDVPVRDASAQDRRVHVPQAVRRAYARSGAPDAAARRSPPEEKRPAQESKPSDSLPTFASFVCETGQRREAPMRKNVFRIGFGPQNDLDLHDWLLLDSDCGDSARPDLHAVVVRDKLSGAFELLNYAEDGSLVDGVLYGPECVGGWEGAAELRVNSRVQLGKLLLIFQPADADLETQASRLTPDC